MSKLPPLLRRRTQTEEERAEPVEEEEVPASLGLDPLLARLTLMDWTSADVLENPEARSALQELVDKCHPEVLHSLLNHIKARLCRDVTLWGMKEDVTRSLQLGDQIYTRKRRRR